MAGELNIDSIIARLLEVKGARPGKNVQLAENEIKGLCLKAREIFLSQPILLVQKLLKSMLIVTDVCQQLANYTVSDVFVFSSFLAVVKYG